MAMINVQVLDATGNRREQVTLPSDQRVDRILVKLADKMVLPSAIRTAAYWSTNSTTLKPASCATTKPWSPQESSMGMSFASITK